MTNSRAYATLARCQAKKLWPWQADEAECKRMQRVVALEVSMCSVAADVAADRLQQCAN